MLYQSYALSQSKTETFNIMFRPDISESILTILVNRYSLLSFSVDISMELCKRLNTLNGLLTGDIGRYFFFKKGEKSEPSDASYQETLLLKMIIHSD